MSDPSRTEQATPKRLNKARGEGNVARSQEVGKALSVLAGYIILWIWMGQIYEGLTVQFKKFLTIPKQPEIDPASFYIIFYDTAFALAKMLLPILLFIATCMYLAGRLQVGKLWSTKVFKPKLSKFNPISGLKRMLFSAQTFVRLFKSLAQAFFIGIAPVLVIKADLISLIDLFDFSAYESAVFILVLGQKTVKYALVPMLLIAIIDLVYTRWQYKNKLKMTKGEVKDEHKQSEGDPMVKNKMRQKMMSLSMNKMMHQVPDADVILTNPTHLAIALRYNTDEAPAPIVVAKGANQVAERIKELARENNVPIRQNVPLARALYKQAEVGDMIPAELYQAVALLLAQIWKNNPRPQQD